MSLDHQAYLSRHITKCIALSHTLIDAQGKWELDALKNALLLSTRERFCPGAVCAEEQRCKDHLHETLRCFLNDDTLRKKLLTVHCEQLPQTVLELIRHSLHLDSASVIDISSTRRAVLLACLTYLRQEVGSCFATAPAIIIHTQNRHRFLDELIELIHTQSLKKIVEGKELLVPMSPSWSHTSLTQLEQARQTQNPLLRTWEYTVASFCDGKSSQSGAKLFYSLGFEETVSEGFGELIYAIVKEKLEQANRCALENKTKYEERLNLVRSLETRRQRPNSETDARWQKAEYTSLVNELKTYEFLYEESRIKARTYSELYAYLIEAYTSLLPKYFQEVFDSNLSPKNSHPHDDRPAGFRLFFKHGRSKNTTWTPIENHKDFTTALIQFFTHTEVDVIDIEGFDPFRKDLIEVITALCQYAGKESFINACIARSQTQSKASLREYTLPWAWVSGGSFHELVRTYLNADAKPIEKSVESPTELLIFLTDTLKSLPQTEKRLLMYSPSHAFILDPRQQQFRSLQEDSRYTYTCVRDDCVNPQRDFWDALWLYPQETKYLLSLLNIDLYPSHRLHTYELYDWLIEQKVPKIPPPDIFGAHLYNTLPLIGYENARSFAQQYIKNDVPAPWEAFVSSRELFFFIKNQLPLECAIDQETYLMSKMREANFLPKEPLAFADANWHDSLLAFCVNPATTSFELWKFDERLLIGEKMQHWENFFHAEDCKWGMYPNLHL